MKNLPAPIITKHENFFVLRDDLLEGGTKRRILTQALAEVSEPEIVYAAHAYGYAGYALGLASKVYGKSLRLFFPSPMTDVEIFQKTVGLSNVSFSIERVTKQHELVETAKQYALEKGAYFMPIGCNT